MQLWDFYPVFKSQYFNCYPILSIRYFNPRIQDSRVDPQHDREIHAVMVKGGR
jgi:hypothetical protein